MFARALGVPAADGDLDLVVGPGDVVLVRGPNGSGKTSLLRALAGLDAPIVPRLVEFGGTSAGRRVSRPSSLGFSMQDPHGALVGLTVEGEMRLRRRALPGELARFSEREIATLSSGEARRVSFAVADGADVLLLDEPSEGLDAAGRARLVDMVRRAQSAGRAVVAADHDGVLDAIATRTIHLGPREPVELPSIPRRGGPVMLSSVRTMVRGIELPPLSLPAGFHALVGPNGCGKTTLLRHVAGLDRDGPVHPFAPADARATFTQATVRAELAHVDPAIGDLLVPGSLRARHPLTLSGGEAQRVSLAKALGRPSAIVLLDEPEAHLDAPGRHSLARALRARVEVGACVLAATHDAGIVALADRVVRMEAAS